MNKFRQPLIALSVIFAFVVNASAQEIHIKARFFEVSKETLEAFQKDFEFANSGAKLLTPKQTLSVLKRFHSDSSVETLAEPEMLTASGRHAQMRATQTQAVVTNFTFEENPGNPSVVPQFEKAECGSILDVVPSISSGNQILLKTMASFVTFLGYADSKNAAAHFATNSAGEQVTLPAALPQFYTQHTSTKIVMSDGQTVLMFPKSSNGEKIKFVSESTFGGIFKTDQNPTKDKFFIVMITPTIVDAAGNRIYSDN
jgi:Flp pilus assembly secretin CpaC